MKNSYPIILTADESGYSVYIPDFDIGTQGTDLTEAIEMARDAIGIMGIDMEDDGKPLPNASNITCVERRQKNDVVTLVDVDFAEYRRKNDLKVVKKNCTIPNWLCYRAEKANLNFSQILAEGIKRELNITERP